MVVSVKGATLVTPFKKVSRSFWNNLQDVERDPDPRN